LAQFLTDVRSIAEELSIEDSKCAVAGYLSRLRSKGYKGATTRRKIASLRTFFTHAESFGWIDNQPVRWREVRVHTSPSLPRVIADVDLARILSAASRDVSRTRVESNACALACRDLAVIELLYYTGARVGEILGLKIDQCDIERKTAVILGKGGKSRLLTFDAPPVYLAVKAYLSVRENLGPRVGNVFVSRSGRPLAVSDFENRLRRICSTAGVMKVTPHAFRHTMATTLLENGADLRSVQELLGHSNVRTTQIYTHVSSARKADVLRRFHSRIRIMNN
jgi:site-specific recombinase XerD